jgi:hypothetical protein
MSRIVFMAVCFCLVAALPLRAGQFIVDQKHPQASDDNPGTLDKPWKTIAKAGKTLQAGDIARIKAGRYREGLIHFANNGRRVPVDDETYIVDGPAKGHQFQPITLEAFGDGEVVPDGSVELPPEGWSLVEGRKSVYVSKVDDGKGGWTDQGPGADMNNLTPGKKEYQGVPFDLLQPNTCVVLKALQCRPQNKDLPAKVTIDVGRKADVLYFLHDTAWCIEDAEVFRYVIHYDDNTELKLPIIGGQHIWDWTAGHQAKFTKKFQGVRPSVAQTLGGGAVFPQVNVYMLEWLNPNPNKAIKSVEFISGDCSVPILLGITCGRTRSGK